MHLGEQVLRTAVGVPVVYGLSPVIKHDLKGRLYDVSMVYRETGQGCELERHFEVCVTSVKQLICLFNVGV